jgi:aminoglycoside phosphotransferase (APT) family kinase protein
MTRSPLFLAALASTAVPGLDPASAEAVAARPGDLFEVAYVQDTQDRRWVVKAPCTPAAGAMLDDITALCSLLGRRLDVAVPMFRGHAPVPEGRAVVYLRVPGRPLDFSALDAGPLAAEVGRTLAHIHNIEHLLFEEAGRPTYDAEAHRHRRLSDLDRAASTGHVPTGLLTRWERLLEDVSLWRFAPVAVHGAFAGDNVLAAFDDEDDASSGHVRGVLAWELSRIGDPADDFAELVSRAPPEALDAVLEAYATSRVERPDANLVRRARLAAEMAPLSTLLHALASGQLPLVERTAGELREQDARVDEGDRRHAEEDAARSERTRLAKERALAAASRNPDDPEAALPDPNATQPHPPFPMLGETQYIDMAPLLTDDEPQASDLPAEPAAQADPAEPAAQGEPEERPSASAPAQEASEETRPLTRAPRLGLVRGDAAPLPFVSAGADDGAAFEIDDVEALPESVDAVLDLHEGASDFVPVPPSDRRQDDHAS